MQKKFSIFLSAMVLTAIMFGFISLSSDPTGTKVPSNEPLSSKNPQISYSNSVVKYVDSLNGANDSTALRLRGYIPKKGPTAGPSGTLNNWFQGVATNFVAYEGPTTGYVSANFNLTSGANNIDLWLISPPVNGQAGDTLSFFERSPTTNPFPDSIRVYWASNGDTIPGSGSFVELGRFLTTISGSWGERRFVLPSGGATGRFAINYRVVNGGPSGANSNLIGVDMIRLLGAPLNTTLLLVHDSTQVTTQAERKKDRDSMRTYLGALVGNYDVVAFDTNTTLSSLSQYTKIVVQETAFDAAPCRYMGLTARTNLTAWLNTGTVGNPKKLYMLGGDLGYNYSRTGSGAIDPNFSGTVCGFVYKLDNAFPSPGNIVGITVDAGNSRPITTPGANYYPDGCSLNNGSLPLYRYGNHTAADTLSGIVRTATNYEVRSLFCDPRYFSGGFQPVLTALFGNLVVGINPTGNSVPQVYTLGQNYPNPFNPTTNIKFGIPKSSNVKLVVYDILGREVMTLVNEFKTAGSYVVDFNATMLASGAYFYRIEAGSFVETKKMLLVK